MCEKPKKQPLRVVIDKSNIDNFEEIFKNFLDQAIYNLKDEFIENTEDPDHYRELFDKYHRGEIKLRDIIEEHDSNKKWLKENLKDIQ